MLQAVLEISLIVVISLRPLLALPLPPPSVVAHL